MSDRRGHTPWQPEPGDIIPPTKMRHRPKPPKTQEEEDRAFDIALAIQQVLFSHRLGLEIQSACGLCPPDEAQREGLEKSRRSRSIENGTLPGWAFETLEGAFESLLAAQACSHCEARHECRAPRRLAA